MTSEQDAEPSTLEELAAEQHRMDRPTHVHVVGDWSADPPKGIATAKRVASILADDGEVIDEDYGQLEEGDVAFVRIDKQPVRGFEEYNELYELASLSRVKQLAGIVVFTKAVDTRVEAHLSARVWAESGDVERVEQLEVDPFDSTEVHAIELDGLVSAHAE